MKNLDKMFKREAELAKTKTMTQLQNSLKFWEFREARGCEIVKGMIALIKAEIASRIGRNK